MLRLGNFALVAAVTSILTRWPSYMSLSWPVFSEYCAASEKSSINANRKSTTRFPMSLRWSTYVSPKPSKGGSRTQNGRFPSKIALRLKKVCYRVSLCENCQRQSYKTFIGLTICTNMIGGATPSTWIFGSSNRVGTKSPIFDLFSLVAPQP